MSTNDTRDTVPSPYKYLVYCDDYGTYGIQSDEELERFKQINYWNVLIDLTTHKVIDTFIPGPDFTAVRPVPEDWLARSNSSDDAE